MAKKHKRASLPTVSTAKVVSVAMSIAQINDRNAEISQRIGKLNAEASKLSAEFGGNDRRKLELMREFDSAAKS